MSPFHKLGQYIQKIFLHRHLMALHTLFLYRTYDFVFGPLLDKWQPDIIHAHDGVTLPTAARAAKRLGAKLIFDSHELEVHRSPPLTYLRRLQVQHMEKKNLHKADRVITVTELAADYLAHEYGIRRPVVLFNAPPEKPGPMPEQWQVRDRDNVRADLRLRKDVFLFAYTGNITLNRGLELAIIALSKVQSTKDQAKRGRTGIHLAAIGKIQSGQDVAIKRLAQVYGVEDKVHLLPPVAPHEVAKYVSSADASIIPILPVTLSYDCAMPNKLFEAMLSGNPILCSDLLEMGPFVTSNGLGLTYEPDSPDDCAQKMLELIEDPGAFARSVKRQAELTEKYAWEAQERKLLKMYEEL